MNSRPPKVVVIGSGASGLTAGILCAKEGSEVTLLEQHAVPGGLMQTYYRHGRKLPTGVHCVGSLTQGDALWRYLKYLGVYDRIDLRKMPDDCIAEFRFPDFQFRMPTGHDRFADTLNRQFPDEGEAIRRYIDDMRRCVKMFPLYECRLVSGDSVSHEFLRPLSEYLDQLTDNETLKTVLAANILLVGSEPSVCPVYVQLLFTDSFLRGSYRIDERKTTLAKAFVEALQEAGGELRCRSIVTKIICQDGAVRGVIANGQEIPADIVIYTGHPTHLLDLCDADVFRKSYRTRLMSLENTMGTFGMAVSWDDPVCPASDYDVYLYANTDIEAVFRQRLTQHDAMPEVIFCSAHPTVNDDGFTLTSLVPIHQGEMKPWEKSHHGKRSEDYYDVKQRIADRMLAKLVEAWPHMDGRLSIIDTNTPLTFRDYTLTPDGSAYGVKRSTDHLLASRILPVTKVQNLFLAGQSVVLSGIMGAVISGVLVGTIIHGGEYLLDKIQAATT